MAAVEVGDNAAERVAQARGKDNRGSRLNRHGGFGPLRQGSFVEAR